MLEKVPHVVGRALRGLRAGCEKLVSEDEAFRDASPLIRLESPAFFDGGSIPARFTADGPGVSPPLVWRGAPPGTHSLVLIVEDPDAPAREPLTHLLAFDLAPGLMAVDEGAFPSPDHDGDESDLGRNAFRKAAWLPPDPPTGHGQHHYVFQLFALNRRLSFERPPSRSELTDAMRGHVLAKGVLAGVYARE